MVRVRRRSKKGTEGDEFGKNVTITYLVARKLEKVVNIWIEEMSEEEYVCFKSRTLGLIRPQFHRRASVCALGFLCEFGCLDWLLPVCRIVC